jgi:hypothetical protein
LTSIRSQIDGLRIGNQLTIGLSGNNEVKGSLVAKGQDGIQVRVDRGLFRHRITTCDYADIVSVKKNRPTWVVPVIVLSAVVVGVVVGLYVCFVQGECVQ